MLAVNILMDSKNRMIFNFYTSIFYTKYILYLFILVLVCRQITSPALVGLCRMRPRLLETPF